MLTYTQGLLKKSSTSSNCNRTSTREYIFHHQTKKSRERKRGEVPRLWWWVGTSAVGAEDSSRIPSSSSPTALLSHIQLCQTQNLMKNSIAREGNWMGVERASSPKDGAANTKSGEVLKALEEDVIGVGRGTWPRDLKPHQIHTLDSTLLNHWPQRPLLTRRWSSPCTEAVDSYRSAHHTGSCLIKIELEGAAICTLE